MLFMQSLFARMRANRETLTARPFPLVATTLVAALGMTAGHAAHAQNLIVNGGFESPVIATGSVNDIAAGGSIGAWTVVGSDVSLISNGYSEPQNGVASFNAQAGVQSVDLTGAYNTGVNDGVTQSIGTIIGQQYAISFYVGHVTSTTGSAYYTDSTIADLSINGGARSHYTFSAAGVSGQDVWQQFNTSFVATTTTTSVTFYNGTASSNQNYVGLDNVSVTASASAPEPTALVFLTSGAMGMFVVRRHLKAVR